MILVCCEHPIQDTLGFLGPPYILTGIPELLVFFPNNYSSLQYSGINYAGAMICYGTIKHIVIASVDSNLEPSFFQPHTLYVVESITTKLDPLSDEELLKL